MAASMNSVDDDDFLCSTHRSHVVALYCQTCEDLICPRCISQGASGTGDHRQHVYLDLNDGYDLKKDEFDKVITNFHDVTQTRKNERAELNSAIQHVKLGLLRKKTEATKQTRALHDAIRRLEADYVRLLESIVEPAIERKEAFHRDVDYEAVSRDGLIGSAQSLQQISAEKCIQYLRGQSRVEKDMVKLSLMAVVLPDDPMPELARLRMIHLDLKREKHSLRQRLSFPQTCPAQPRVLSSWCTVGSQSASVVFKCSQSVAISHYRVHCSTYSGGTRTNNKSQTRLTPPNMTKAARLEGGDIVFNIRRFSPGRTCVTLRGLKVNTKYALEIWAVNLCGSSDPATCYFTTAAKNTDKICFQPVGKPACRVCQSFCANVFRIMMSIFAAILFAWAIFGMYFSADVLYEKIITFCGYICDLALHQNLTLIDDIYKTLCPRKVPEFLELSRDSSNVLEDVTQSNSLSGEFHTIWDWFLSMFISDIM